MSNESPSAAALVAKLFDPPVRRYALGVATLATRAFAEKVGVNERTVRVWEKERLLQKAPMVLGRVMFYAADLDKGRAIRAFQAMGLTLAEISILLDLAAAGGREDFYRRLANHHVAMSGHLAAVQTAFADLNDVLAAAGIAAPAEAA